MVFIILCPPYSVILRFACLVVVWAVAMLIGFLYKRFVAGAKGWEQVPLINFYRSFGNLEAVSIDNY